MKVKPQKGGRIRRRVVTISIYATGFIVLTVLSPIWLVAALLLGAVRRKSFIWLRLLCFGWFYFGFELIALSLVLLLLVGSGSAEARTERLYRLQAWWATVNLRFAQALLQLTIEVDDADVATPGPSILLVRHASILDTLLPCAYVQAPTRFRVRYVLKQELLFDPCIDVVGNLLPNYFIDRTGDTAEELEGIRKLATNLGTDGLLIFPEGTRFSEEKRRRALEKLEAEGSALSENAHALLKVLPPKPGGVLTLLDTLPDVDCVFFAHTGLEAFAKIESLSSGEIVGGSVRAKLWRVRASEIPKEHEERLRWLYAQWAKVDAFVRNAGNVS